MRGMDVDLGDLVRALEGRPRFESSLRHGLRKLAERKALCERAADAEGLAELRCIHRLLAHHLEEAVGAFEHLVRPGYSFFCELDGEDRLAAGIGRRERL